jgi:hypothetical protein
MIDESEELISFAEAAKHVPPNGVDRATISRWARWGVNKVVLEATKIGGRRYTSLAALEQFLDECKRRGTLGYASSELRERAAAKARLEVAANRGDAGDGEIGEPDGDRRRRADRQSHVVQTGNTQPGRAASTSKQGKLGPRRST